MNPKIEKLIKKSAGIKLDIGCGEKKQAGFIGMDMRPLKDVDIVWDVEQYPWPLPDACVLTAVCSHLVEHLEPHGGGFIKFMDECWRVLKPSGQLAIACPYAGSFYYYQDPTHCNPINEATFQYFDPLSNSDLYTIYRPKPWKIEMLTFKKTGNMEVLLSKRLLDPSYGHQG